MIQSQLNINTAGDKNINYIYQIIRIYLDSENSIALVGITIQ